MAMFHHSLMLIIVLFIVRNDCFVHQIGTKLTRYQYRNIATSPMVRYSNKGITDHENFQIDFSMIRNVIGASAGSSILFSHPSVASAIAEPAALEALQLLSGYQTRTPYFITWGMMGVLAYAIAFEVWKKWLAAW